MIVLGRRAEDIEQFVERLEAHGRVPARVTRARDHQPAGAARESTSRGATALGAGPTAARRGTARWPGRLEGTDAMLRRLLTEQRKFVVLLAVALAVNVGVYAGFVYPLAARVADADNRAARAGRALREAQREFDAAKGVAASKERAEDELRAVLRRGAAGGPQRGAALTYLNLAQLARTSNLRVVRRDRRRGPQRGSALDRLQVALVLEGQYEDVRAFVHTARDVAPTFVIIDDVDTGPGA